MSKLVVGTAVLVDREGGLTGTIIDSRPGELHCRIEDGRNMWVPVSQVRSRVAAQREARVVGSSALAGSRRELPGQLYQAPRVEQPSAWSAPHRDWKWLLFSFEGRIPRGSYWLTSFLSSMPFLVLICMALFASVGSLSQILEPQPPVVSPLSEEVIGIIFGLVLLSLLPFAWIQLALSIKRWHDRGKSGVWVFIHIIPYIGGLWAFIELGCLRGTIGVNQYGPDPLA